jgi:hypothetical protein
MGLFTETKAGLYCEDVLKLKGQENNLFKIVLDNKAIKDLIKFLNTEKQLGQQHIDSLGQELYNTLTQRTVYADSDPLGRGGQPYEVRRTGDYWGSFTIAVNAGNIVIVSNPFKQNNNLFEVYTPELEGLTDENLQILIDEALQKYREWYARNLLPG